MNLNNKITITFLDVLMVLFPTQKGIHGLVMELIILNKIWHLKMSLKSIKSSFIQPYAFAIPIILYCLIYE